MTNPSVTVILFDSWIQGVLENVTVTLVISHYLYNYIDVLETKFYEMIDNSER